jgi:hypothetical protein
MTLRNLQLSRILVLAAVLLPAAVGWSATTEADAANTAAPDAIAALQSENEHLRSLIPSQSHAMMDVAYHFTNLWFAGQHRNWPLAQFYFNETRNHIQWAVRLVPVRKTSHGDLQLGDMFSALDATLLADLKQQIVAKDLRGFTKSYRAAITGCNACHTAADKPFLHVTVPDQPEASVIDFAPTPAPGK